MIHIRVAELMGRKRLTQKQLAEITGLRPNYVSDLWHGKIKRIEIEQIDRLCKAFNCQPGDLFEYLPEDEKSTSTVK